METDPRQVKDRRVLVERDHPKLSLTQQCILLGLSRTGLYYEPKRSLKDDELAIKDAIDRKWTRSPYYGIRRMKEYLSGLGFRISRKRVSRYYKQMRITTIYPKPKMTFRNEEHKVYPYLLRNLEITQINQVWSTDITYIPMEGGFMYLCAIIDWHSRYVLSWGISNTHDSEFCGQVLRRALEKHGRPEIFNSDQGSEFTATAFTDILKENEIQISMDGKGRALDNIFIERLWRSVKYEYVYLNRPQNGIELYQGLEFYFQDYNENRQHQSLKYKTPHEVFMAA